MDRDKTHRVNPRLSILFTIVFLALAILILRLSYIQLVDGDKYRKRAEGNRFAEKVIPAPRGWIMDRNKTVMVDNRPSFSVIYTLPPDQKEEVIKQTTLEITKKLLPVINKDSTLKEKMTETSLFNKLMGITDQLPASVPRKIILDAKDDQVAYIKEHQQELPGVSIQAEPIRDYKYKTTGSHIIGYMNSIPPEKLKEYLAKGYQPTDHVGVSGLEAQYESYLRGKDGFNKVEVNINGEPVNQFERVEPTKGDDLVLNIDLKLQEATEAALKERVTTLGAKPGSKVTHAAAVAMDPNTGEVLAMASYPPFDPNQWVKGLSEKEYKQFLNGPNTDYASGSPLAPGSTIKPLTVMIGLKEGVITKDEEIYCPGYKYIGQYRAGDWLAGGHGLVNGAKAIAESCNVYMYTLGMRLAHFDSLFSPLSLSSWKQRYDLPAFNMYLKYGTEFGLGVKTGIDLPYESTGTANYLEQTAVTMPFTAIGQTESYTPLQLAQYVSTIANGGKRMEPHLVKQIIDPSGKVISEVMPKVLNTVSFTKDQLDYVKSGMKMVTSEPFGTAYSVFYSKPYNPAGKTGTAESGKNTEHSWFVGFAPYDKPKIVIAVVIPDTQVGGHSYELSSVIAEKMLDAYFQVTPKQKK